MITDDGKGGLLGLATQILTGYLRRNQLTLDELPGLIREVHHALAALDGTATVAEALAEPAVPIRRSVTPDYLICLEDGKKLKMLKRHLRTTYDMSPEEYRRKWGLAADYPMVAPKYAEQRSTLARKIGLGRSRRR